MQPIFILNIMVDLLTPNCFKICFFCINKLCFFLEFFKNFSLLICYPNHVIFLAFDDFLKFLNYCCHIFIFFVTLLVFSSGYLFSCHSPLIMESSIVLPLTFLCYCLFSRCCQRFISKTKKLSRF